MQGLSPRLPRNAPKAQYFLMFLDRCGGLRGSTRVGYDGNELMIFFERQRMPKIFIRASLLLAGGGLLAYMVGAGVAASRLPDEFVRARQSVAAISQQIVDLSSLTGEKLSEVNLSDLRGETAQALMLISDARAANDSAYRKAFELTQRLQELAQSLKGVSSATKQREGAEAIAVELSLVSEFIIYTQKVDAFLDALERAIRLNIEANRAAAATALTEVNAKVISINALNNSFREAIGIFDEPEE